MKVYSLDEVKDELLGKVGTPKRNSFEEELEKELYREEIVEHCNKCGKEQSETIHTCPYKTDMHKDKESLCNCCDRCYKNCLGDI